MHTPNDDDPLRRLLDRAALGDLLSRYCDALDLRQWSLLEDVFTPEVMTHWPAGTEERGGAEFSIEGRDAVVGWLARIFEAFGPTHHMISNVVVELERDRAQVACRVHAHHVAEVAGRRLFEESLARFSGAARRTADGWRFETFRESIAIALGDADEVGALLATLLG